MAEIHSKRQRQPRTDLTDAVFGRLTVVSWAGNSRWNCVCSCGRSAVVLTANLNRSNTKSCGCLKPSVASARATTHGLSDTIVYRTWLGVRRRCRDTKFTSYPTYGAKGVDIWDEWHDSLAAFVRDVGHPPSDGHTLDRIDNNKGYIPGNVRWATTTEQARNRSNCRRIAFQGAEYPSLSAFVEWLAPQIDCNPPSLERALAGGFRRRPKR